MCPKTFYVFFSTTVHLSVINVCKNLQEILHQKKNVGIFRKKRKKEEFSCCRLNVCGNKEALVFALSQFAGSLLGLFVLGYK